MSFKPNDINATINLGNYEEFFILYMDNELTAEQKAMVDTFLLLHPDLQLEFDLIKSLQLQPEKISFNKERLLADQMKMALAEEDLLLYIDNELPAEKAKELEAKIQADKDLTLQHNILLQTKLNASEKLVYPNKAELYRREQRTVRLGGWMRVAAAIVVIATAGVLYFNSKNTGVVSDHRVAHGSGKETVKPNASSISDANKLQPKEEIAESRKEIKSPVDQDEQKNDLIVSTKTNKVKDQIIVPVQDVVSDDNDVMVYQDNRERSTGIDANPVLNTTSVTGIPKDFINTSVVTSNVLPRTTINGATAPTIADPDDDSDKVASNKGSLKGLLRKATRVIEKRTGIEAANENDEILIGALALKLK